MDRIILVFGFSDIGEPLGGQARPLQGMGHHEVIKKWSVFLPYLVLFIDYAF